MNGKDLLTRATGKFYTHELIGRHLARAVVRCAAFARPPDTLRVVEPFCGDGRLVCWFLEALAERGAMGKSVSVEAWDCDGAALAGAVRTIADTASRLGLRIGVKPVEGDSFAFAPRHFGRFHVCVTNPPWEHLKPDRRDLESLGKARADDYVEQLRQRDRLLAELYPLSQPQRKFSGWGTNLARSGVEAALRLVAPGGVAGVVAPASLLADQMSAALRTWLFRENAVCDLAYYVAEARLFEKVDQPSVTLVAVPGGKTDPPPAVSVYDREHARSAVEIGRREWLAIEGKEYVFPLQFGLGLIGLDALYADLPRFADLEGDGLWAGRELDETNHARFLGRSGKYLFLKGRMVTRYGLAEQPTRRVKTKGLRVPKSADHHRIAWRDVSRPNQKRRVQATLIPPGWLTGNSLHVAYFEDGNLDRLKALLAVMNSFAFEAQARAHLATAHVSLGVVRQVHVPGLEDPRLLASLAAVVDRCLKGEGRALREAEVAVARLYGLGREEFERVLGSFEKVEEGERAALLAAWDDLPARRAGVPAPVGAVVIPNHLAPTLSDLDKQMVRTVPPGGNWKDIPDSIPSQRLAQIRVSYAAGEGSRSTYYGRLHPDAPAYTINTYFGRPGNGCHIHFDFEGGQHRTISQREAARLQSFPDRFVFLGNRGAVGQQIGNAVPPLLGYQVAAAMPCRGRFIDLFCGAGGLGLGFLWAGWQPVVANDREEAFLRTYRHNVHGETVAGDIRKQEVFDEVIARAEAALRGGGASPLFVLGGPPCQGFSTAGNRRSMGDERNWLFRQYKAVIERLRPDGFLFENVPGLLNMEGGKVFAMIREELRGLAPAVRNWQLRSELYGIPQRRTRVVILGSREELLPSAAPPKVTRMPDREQTLFDNVSLAVTVRQALSDLPPLEPGEDGSCKDYVSAPAHPFQELMRGLVTPAQYLDALQSRREQGAARSQFIDKDSQYRR
jgi:Alw26I/Eco31I/Esp3I family type II restriction m6 adenine DNA methyltransferase